MVQKTFVPFLLADFPHVLIRIGWHKETMVCDGKPAREELEQVLPTEAGCGVRLVLAICPGAHAIGQAEADAQEAGEGIGADAKRDPAGAGTHTSIRSPLESRDERDSSGCTREAAAD
ncbi:hypothetical protein ACP4OV_002764 [Aristida adscensionis]